MAGGLVPIQPGSFITIMAMLKHPIQQCSYHKQSCTLSPQLRFQLWLKPALTCKSPPRRVQFAQLLFMPTKILPRAPRRTSPRRQQSRNITVAGEERAKKIRSSLENAKEIVQQSQVRCFHSSESCGMRPRAQGGGVDERLRVYGVRIVDASVFFCWSQLVISRRLCMPWRRRLQI